MIELTFIYNLQIVKSIKKGWPQKNYISAIPAQITGVQSQKYKKNATKVPNFRADLKEGSHFGLLCKQNGSNCKKFLPPES